MHKYKSHSVGLNVKVFNPRCGPGQQVSWCSQVWSGAAGVLCIWVDVGSSRCQLSAPPDKGRVKPGAAQAETQFPTRSGSLCLFPSFSGEAERRAWELRAPSPSTQPLFECDPTPGAPATTPPSLTCDRVTGSSTPAAVACLCAGLSGCIQPE